MEYVILVNRTSKPLEATWNGKRYKLVPGDNPLPRNVAEAAKRQNPIMGTGQADFWATEYLVGIKEFNDPIDPIEQSTAKELMDPQILHAAKLAAGFILQEVPGTAQIYRNVQRLQNEDGVIPQSAGFTHNEASAKGPELP